MGDAPYSAKIHIEYVEWLSIECTACKHSVSFPMSDISSDDRAKLSEGRKRLRCSKCGARQVSTRRYWKPPSQPG